ncbi:MAG TPA: protein kinase [Pyrinomonadaceae bacterium]|nr:protein kinase [Pyrinomonadaceae bacterium]
MLEIGSIINDRYQVDERLAFGGLGFVHRGYDLRLEAPRAIKFIREDLSMVTRSICIERFQREAQAIAQVGAHQNVAAVFDYGELPCHYIVMELVDGETLSTILEREKRLGLDRAIKLMKQICSGIAAVHARQIVHRDLKTSNIIITETSDGELAKVIDFGIAKLPDSDSGGLWTKYTQMGWSMGTPEYMPPEQWDDASAARTQSDVYSLAMICFELLTGSLPFHANKPAEYRNKHRLEVPPPFEKELDVPPELESVLLRALAKDPDERQNNAKDLADELMGAIGEATQAKLKQEEMKRLAKEKERRDKLEAKLAKLTNEAKLERKKYEAAITERETLKVNCVKARHEIESLTAIIAELRKNAAHLTRVKGAPVLSGLLIGGSLATWLIDWNSAQRWLILTMVIISVISLGLGGLFWWMGPRNIFRKIMMVSIFTFFGFSVATLVFLALGSASNFMVERGNADRNAKSYDKAIGDYRLALALNPKNSNAHFDRGLAYALRKDHDKAITEFDEYIRLNPNVWAFFNRGVSYANKSEYDQAIGDYTETLNFTPNQSEVYRSRGLSYYGKKDYEKAIADYDEAIRLNPNNADAYKNRGNAFQQMNQKDKANADFAKAGQLKRP